ncbi:FAD-dependent monooxygenase [Streptomyces sp. NPDC006660]|uniref:FAD-dependent monooxygenase n=1 Tax=Streptomyces sp. NPDC006660 TaxID=3156901 RepID=UPI0033C83998
MHKVVATRVVVVGGGPVGMVVAAELAGYGIDTVVLESKTTIDEHPKANTLHARTVQGLVRRGYLDLPVSGTRSGTVTTPFHFGGLTGLSITTPACEPPALLKRAQADLERDFEKSALEKGARVLRGHRVVEARQSQDHAVVVAEGPQGTVEFRADFVVGADGARSTVREQFAFPADVREPTVSASMGVVRVGEPGALAEGWRRTARGWTVARALPDGRHLVRVLDLGAPHPDRHTPLTRAELQEQLSRISGHEVPLTDAQSLSRFSDFTRIVHSYRQGRVFLAGDAAHVHFPIGGQGLSTGLLDALNLAWKLAFHLRGTAGPGLLDSYDSERRPVAQQVVDNTLAQLTLMRPDSDLDPLRALFDSLLSQDEGGRLIGGMVSAQGLCYPPRAEHSSAWEGRFLDNETLETEDGPLDVITLLRDGRPLLLVLGDAYEVPAGAAAWAPVLRTVRAAASAHGKPSAVLVRPDGYVAWAPDGEELTGALRGWFGEPR